MLRYMLRRVLASIPVLFGVLAVTFALARMVPGDPCTAMHKPIPIQFAIYSRDILKGDLGNSLRFQRPVTQILVERLPQTIELGLSALFLATLLGVPAGILSALRHNSLIDVATMIFANIGVSMPVFWLGLMLAYVFALVFGKS